MTTIAAMSCAIVFAGLGVATAQPADEPAAPAAVEAPAVVDGLQEADEPAPATANEAPAATITEDGTAVVPPEGTEASPKAEDQGLVRPNIADAEAARSSYDPEKETEGYGPVQKNFVAGFLYSITHPNVAPQGANDWSCKPTKKHPNPVVLIHGTWENAYDNFAAISPALKAEGYCVFALNYGDSDISLLGHVKALRGTASVAKSAKEIATYVDAVRDRTGAAKVDIVGHSQGPLVTRQYLRYEGGANPSDTSKNKVDKVVSIAGTNHGTTLLGIGQLGRTINNLGLNVLGLVGVIAGPAAADQVVDSPLIKKLDAGGDTEPGVNYTVLATRFDETVTPYKSSFLTEGPGAKVKNVRLQTGCGLDFSDHLSITVSPRAIGIVKNALDPKGFPDKKIPCKWNAPITGG